MEKTASEILNESADILSEEGVWIKNRYIGKGLNRRGCTMCAHGAIAYAGSREIRNDVKETVCMIDGNKASYLIDEASAKASKGMYQTAANAATPSGYSEEFKAAELAKLNSQGWAHYIAIKNGMTIGFNDAGTTTKQQVIDKLRACAVTAQEQGK
jgi:hypothetical protein